MRPAIVLLEFDSIAVGIMAGDAMVKRAPVSTVHAGSVQPGKFLVLVGGDVASVEEARQAGRETGAARLVAEIFLPEVHPNVVEALTGRRLAVGAESLGVLETSSVSAVLGAADRALKGAKVELAEIRLADGLGGKGYALFVGEVADVEEAVEIGARSLHGGELVAKVVIPRLHPEMSANLSSHPEFGARMRADGGGE